MRTYNNLIKRVENGEPMIMELNAALKFERKQIGKMDLSDFISPLNYSTIDDYETKKTETHNAYIETVADAKRNIPLLENAIIKLNGSIAPQKPHYNFTGYAHDENVNDNNGLGL